MSADDLASRTALYDYLDVLLRRKWLALGVFLGVLLLTGLFIARTRPVYEAKATLMAATRNAGDILSGATEAYVRLNRPSIANNVELLRSWTMAEMVARSLPDTVVRSIARARGEAAAIELSPAALQSMVTVRPVRDADVIQLAVSARTPAAAVAVANGYLDTYEQYDLDQSRTDVSAIRQFIERQLTIVGGRLDSAERSLQRFKSSHRLADLDAETRALIDRHSHLATMYQQEATEVEGHEAELAHVEDLIDQEGQGMGDKLGSISSPVVANLKATLNQLEVQKINLIIQGFGETSERVKGLDRQIDDARARLRSESQVLIDQQGFVDPVGRLKDLFDTALTLGTELAASRARLDALREALNRSDAALARLPETERMLARLTRDVETDRRVYSLLSERYEEARIQEVGRTSTVRVLDRAQRARRTRPNIASSAALGLILALALAVGSAWAAEHIDTSVRSPRDLQRHGLAVLGSIPQLVGRNGRGRRRDDDVASHLITHTDGESSGAEAFRMLRSSLAFVSTDRPLRSIVVTSPGPSEGKSTVAVNLASVLAQAGSRVLLVDADLRHPMLHTLFGRKRQPGLTDLIVGGNSVESTVFTAGIDRLFCLSSGTIPPSPADLLVSPTTGTLLGRLAGTYDYVVFDTPPVLIAADSPIVGSLVDATIMVVRAGRTSLEAVELARTALANSGTRLVGFVLNGLNRSDRYGRYYYYYGYKYYQGHARRTADGVDPTGGDADKSVGA